MKCPLCSEAELIHDIRDIPHTYSGKETIIQNVEGDFCPSCDEVILGPEESQRDSQEMIVFNNSVKIQL
jgi:HTH-type transcriptional regulator/antitoxin MqsA